MNQLADKIVFVLIPVVCLKEFVIIKGRVIKNSFGNIGTYFSNAFL